MVRVYRIHSHIPLCYGFRKGSVEPVVTTETGTFSDDEVACSGPPAYKYPKMQYFANPAKHSDTYTIDNSQMDIHHHARDLISMIVNTNNIKVVWRHFMLPFIMVI